MFGVPNKRLDRLGPASRSRPVNRGVIRAVGAVQKPSPGDLAGLVQLVRRPLCALCRHPIVCVICTTLLLVTAGCEQVDPCEDALKPYDAPTLIGHLYQGCFPRCAACEQAKVDALLYLDTVNLPTNNGNNPGLVLSSLPTVPIAGGRDRLGLGLDGTLPREIDPGILDQVGWKLRVSGATLEYCESCVDNCGLVPVLSFRADLDSIGFLYDPADTLAIYLRRRTGTGAR